MELQFNKISQFFHPKHSTNKQLAGIIIMFLSSAFLSFSSIFVKLINGIHIINILQYRVIIQLILNYYNLKDRKSIYFSKQIFKYATTRAILGLMCDCSVVIASRYLNLSDAVAVQLTYPIVACILA